MYNNRNHVHSPHIYSHFQGASPERLAKQSEGTMMTKGNLFMSLEGKFRWQFLYSLYFARVPHDLIQFVLKMADLSILMEPTLLPEMGSATSLRKHPFLLALRRWGRSQLRRARRNGCFRRLVSYSILQRFWVMFVS